MHRPTDLSVPLPAEGFVGVVEWLQLTARTCATCEGCSTGRMSSAHESRPPFEAKTLRALYLVLLFALPLPLVGQQDRTANALARSVEQLRSSIGTWDVTTRFLSPDGSIARSAQGTYEFEWIVPDRVVSGRSAIPELGQAAGILFYIREQSQEIEMVSVSADGRLWVMTGPLGGEVRETPEYETQSGGREALRFTRYDVLADSFESKMEYTNDGGRTWIQGNHQSFRRVVR